MVEGAAFRPRFAAGFATTASASGERALFSPVVAVDADLVVDLVALPVVALDAFFGVAAAFFDVDFFCEMRVEGMGWE